MFQLKFKESGNGTLDEIIYQQYVKTKMLDRSKNKNKICRDTYFPPTQPSIPTKFQRFRIKIQNVKAFGCQAKRFFARDKFVQQVPGPNTYFKKQKAVNSFNKKHSLSFLSEKERFGKSFVCNKGGPLPGPQHYYVSKPWVKKSFSPQANSNSVKVSNVKKFTDMRIPTPGKYQRTQKRKFKRFNGFYSKVQRNLFDLKKNHKHELQPTPELYNCSENIAKKWLNDCHIGNSPGFSQKTKQSVPLNYKYSQKFIKQIIRKLKTINSNGSKMIQGSQSIERRRNSLVYKTKKPPPGIMQKGLRDRQGQYFDRKLRAWEKFEKKCIPYQIPIPEVVLEDINKKHPPKNSSFFKSKVQRFVLNKKKKIKGYNQFDKQQFLRSSSLESLQPLKPKSRQSYLLNQHGYWI